MILGIDIAKLKMDVTLLCGKEQGYAQFENTAAGIEQLLGWLAAQGVSELHVCLEATNVYWEAVAEALVAEGYGVSVVNPRRIKGFAMSQMQRNKTDKLDSQVIAAYCAVMKPPTWQPPLATQSELRAWERHRLDLKRTIQQQKNRRDTTQHEQVKASVQRVIDGLEAELKEVERQMEAVTKQCQVLRAKKQRLLSIQGIGPKTSNMLLAEMYDLEKYENARAAAADAGLTPAHYESGSSVHRRPHLCKVGKSVVRGELFMPALNAMRTNPILHAFAERLRAKGKPEKVIICAVMRKLLHIAYGVLKNDTDFDPNYAALPAPA